MTILLGACAVIATLAIAAIAIATIRTMKDFEEAAEELTKTAESVRSSIAQAEVLTRQVQDLAASLETVVQPLKRASTRVEHLSDRAVRLTDAVLNEVETPVRNALALITGVRTGARSLVGAVLRRRGRVHSNGAQSLE